MPPTPENTLVAMNLSKWFWEFTNHSLYTCPTGTEEFLTGYKHYPAKYFAAYVNGGAKYVAHIDAVLRVTDKDQGEVLWKNVDESDESLVARGIPARLAAVNQTTLKTLNKPPCLLFLLSDRKATEFIYDSQGGLVASNVYFDITELGVTNTTELAAKLRTTSWKGLPKRAK